MNTNMNRHARRFKQDQGVTFCYLVLLASFLGHAKGFLSTVTVARSFALHKTLRQVGNAGDEVDCEYSNLHDDANVSVSRRSALSSSGLALSAVMSKFILFNAQPASAESVMTPSIGSPARINAEEAEITHKVFFKVRISRQDGTFYVRDDLPDIPENKVYTGQLVFGLFGKNAPNHVEKFLSYVSPASNPLDDNPLPSYSRSLFTKFDQANGVLDGGMIPSLELAEINGYSAIRYGGRLLPASLWVEKGIESPRVSHVGKGLLTHRSLDVTPVFGITTRSDTTELDSSHTVFGRILLDDSSMDFLKRVEDLPTYSVERPTNFNAETNPEKRLVGDAAELVFNAQREFFRGAAKSFGDTRVSKLYEGKLLRRVEVTQVGIL